MYGYGTPCASPWRIFHTRGTRSFLHTRLQKRGVPIPATGRYAEGRLGGEVEVEHVCCGPGIELIYDFLRQRAGADPALPALGPPEITARALSGECQVGVQCPNPHASFRFPGRGETRILRINTTARAYVSSSTMRWPRHENGDQAYYAKSTN